MDERLEKPKRAGMIQDLEGLSRFERAVSCSNGLGLRMRRNHFLGDVLKMPKTGHDTAPRRQTAGAVGRKGYFLDLTCLSLPSTLDSWTRMQLNGKAYALFART
jgi:hypothetical protein